MSDVNIKASIEAVLFAIGGEYKNRMVEPPR